MTESLGGVVSPLATADQPDPPPTPVVVAATTEPPGARWRDESKIVAAVFLTPAFIALLVLVLWPVLDTIFRSLRDDTGTHFVGLANYTEMFRLDETRRAMLQPDSGPKPRKRRRRKKPGEGSSGPAAGNAVDTAADTSG